MKKWIFRSVALLVLVAGVYFMTRHHRVPAGVTGTGISALAPDFSLPDLTGQKLDLSSYRGKVVLLDFWAT